MYKDIRKLHKTKFKFVFLDLRQFFLMSENIMNNQTVMQKAIEMALENINTGKGGPFAAIVVKDGKIVGQGVNSVTATNDPTAHAEVMAIRDACKNLNTFQLTDCDIYTTCEPCPMCLGALYWARPRKIYYAATKTDAANAGFDDALIYEEIEKNMNERKLPIENIDREKALKIFERWKELELKIEY